MDSPRGRIQLMEKTAQGALRLTPTTVEHFDRCLGCMACVSSCPSGVQYDRLIEATRHVVETEHRRPRAERLQRSLLFATLPYPRRMRWALRLAPLGRALPAPAWARPMLELAPRWRSGERPPPVTPARADSTRAPSRVGLLTGCVQSVVFGDVNAATARVLAAAGYEVAAPAQGCCGALSGARRPGGRVGPPHGAAPTELRRRRDDRRQRLRLRLPPQGSRAPGDRRDRGARRRRAPDAPSARS